MTDPLKETSISGEEKLRARNTKISLYAILMAAAGLSSAVLAAEAVKLVVDGTLPIAALYAVLAVMLGIFIWLTVEYFRRVEELDLLDNLWANTFGFYTILACAVGWAFINQAGAAPPPNGFVLIAVGAIGSVAGYIIRKLGWR